jgi:hypothetical protein
MTKCKGKVGTPKDKAKEIIGWLQDAVGDAADVPSYMREPKWKARIARAKKDGVEDLKGWLADELYNDEDTISDLVGDRVYDASRGSLKTRVAIYQCLAELGHSALERVTLRHIKEDSEWASREVTVCAGGDPSVGIRPSTLKFRLDEKHGVDLGGEERRLLRDCLRDAFRDYFHDPNVGVHFGDECPDCIKALTKCECGEDEP